MKIQVLAALLGSAFANHDGTTSVMTHDLYGRPTTAVVVAPVANCGARAIVSSTGVCSNCPSKTRAQNNNTQCAADACYSW